MIFVSYRTDDSAAYAHRLSEHLVRRLGSDFVYIDRNRIRRGEELRPNISAALASCHMLFAVVGPRWVELLQQRENRETDWVREEITAAIDRGVPTVLVRVGNAAVPAAEILPELMRRLVARRSPVLTLETWEHDVETLILETLPLVPDLEDAIRRAAIAKVTSGFEMLQRLIEEQACVREAVVRSLDFFQTVHEQIRCLDNLKGIHDAIHDIERDYRAILQAGAVLSRSSPRITMLRGQFRIAAQSIRALLDEDSVSEELKLTTEEALEAVQLAFDACRDAAKPDDAALELVATRIQELVSRVPSRLDAEMSTASDRLPLGNLIRVIEPIADQLAATGLDSTKAAHVTDAIAALNALHKQLEARLREHTRVQNLDMHLRQLPMSPLEGKPLTQEQWARVKKRRAKWGAPVSGTMANSVDEIDAMASQLDMALSMDAAMREYVPEDILSAYAGLISSAFNRIDKELRRLCAEFVKVGTPIKTILDLTAKRRAS